MHELINVKPSTKPELQIAIVLNLSYILKDGQESDNLIMDNRQMILIFVLVIK